MDLSRADLGGADLRQADLTEANLGEADLTQADLQSAKLSGAHLTKANLTDADLSWANLSEADLGGADLIRADLHRANLCGATLGRGRVNKLRGPDLSWADLSEADLNRAYFDGAKLRRANLSGANLGDVSLNGVTFSDVDLSGCKNLVSIRHRGPSYVDISTLQRSGSLPPAFLRGVGLPEKLIEYLPSILGEAIQFYSCFISYSSKDQVLADRLHADLQNKGVRCWFARHDMRIGDKIRDTIDEAIGNIDKLLIILSEASIASDCRG